MLKTTTSERIICPDCKGECTVKDYTGDRDTCETCEGKGMLIKVMTVEFKKVN